ncbi:MAG: SH3 domain-containing protein [Wolinella sp.]
MIKKNVKFSLFLLLVGILLVSCTHKPPKTLQSYPQEPHFYLEIPQKVQWSLKKEAIKELKKSYLARFFSPWDRKSAVEKEPFWAVALARENPGYGENRLPNSKEAVKQIIENMDISSYPSLAIPAIVTQDTDVRALPTHKPRFYNFERPGEGYPFDYWQNSYIFSGTPLLITHQTRDKEWLHVESSYVSGWVRSLHVAHVSEIFMKRMRASEWVIPLGDEIALYDSRGAFLDRMRIGKLYALSETLKEEFLLSIPRRNPEGKAFFEKSRVAKEHVAPFPLEYNPTQIAQIAAQIIGEKYGWGGMYGNRDCSAFTRDVVGSMGVWLPRNSAAQGKFHKAYIDLSTLEDKEKERRILSEALPWASLIYMPGHITLYIGEWQGRAMMIHDAWGIRTKEKSHGGRWILGGVVITDLSVGEGVESVDEKRLLLKRVQGFRNLLPQSMLESQNPPFENKNGAIPPLLEEYNFSLLTNPPAPSSQGERITP